MSGAVRRMQQSDPRRVRVLDKSGTPRWHPMWDGNPRIAKPGEVGDFAEIKDGPGARPYVVSMTSHKWTWKAYDCAPGEIYFTDAERNFARIYKPEVVIEPNIKPRASPNKGWPHWQEFAFLAANAGYKLTQLGQAGSRRIGPSKFIETQTFRQACAVLANAKAYIGPDGGMHHAAAALGIPAIVIRGAFISHECTGYASQRNLFTGHGLGCGMRFPCTCCAKAMSKIKPETVLNELREVLA